MSERLYVLESHTVPSGVMVPPKPAVALIVPEKETATVWLARTSLRMIWDRWPSDTPSTVTATWLSPSGTIVNALVSPCAAGTAPSGVSLPPPLALAVMVYLGAALANVAAIICLA